MMYSFDTNVFMDWWDRRYPPDVFPSVQQAMERLVQEEKLFAPQQVRKEIEDVGSPHLLEWAKAHKKLFLPHDEDMQEKAQEIQRRFPDLIDSTALHDEADRWIIALAYLKGYTVVTHETPAREKKHPKRKMFIPDVCKSLNVPCVEFLELMRFEGWKF